MMDTNGSLNSNARPAKYRRPGLDAGITTVRINRNVHEAAKLYATKHNLSLITAIDRLVIAGVKALWTK